MAKITTPDHCTFERTRYLCDADQAPLLEGQKPTACYICHGEFCIHHTRALWLPGEVRAVDVCVDCAARYAKDYAALIAEAYLKFMTQRSALIAEMRTAAQEKQTA